jgi:hypothetical protein
MYQSRNLVAAIAADNLEDKGIGALIVMTTKSTKK